MILGSNFRYKSFYNACSPLRSKTTWERKLTHSNEKLRSLLVYHSLHFTSLQFCITVCQDSAKLLSRWNKLLENSSQELFLLHLCCYLWRARVWAWALLSDYNYCLIVNRLSNSMSVFLTCTPQTVFGHISRAAQIKDCSKQAATLFWQGS